MIERHRRECDDGDAENNTDAIPTYFFVAEAIDRARRLERPPPPID
jgi:hypothetical protein